MDNIITVGSFDVKDTKVNRKGGIREDGTSNTKVVSQVIKNMNIDILGVQELTKNYEYNLDKVLRDYYILEVIIGMVMVYLRVFHIMKVII